MTTVLFTLVLLFSDPNGERRARAALDAAAAAEKNAEIAYASANLDAVRSDLKAVADDMEAADQSLKASGKTPGRNASTYKFAEQRSHELLVRLADLEQKMDSDERELVTASKNKVQEIHDAWFEGIMGRKK